MDTIQERASRISRTRLKPIGGTGRSLHVIAGLLFLSVVAAILSGIQGRGKTISIRSNAPGASIQIDTASLEADSSGSASFANIPFGQRRLLITHADFTKMSTDINLGWFSDNSLPFELHRIPMTLTVNTQPGAELFLNGQPAGAANAQGYFVKQGVPSGEYGIQVKLAGYNTLDLKRHLGPRAEHLFLGLNPTAERVRQAQEQEQMAVANAAKVQQLLNTSQQQLNARQYKAALSSVEEALRLNPANAYAQQLKTQITQTMNILK